MPTQDPILVVNKDATKDDINKAFKKAALKYHPDKGGSEAAFKQLSKERDELLLSAESQINLTASTSASSHQNSHAFFRDPERTTKKTIQENKKFVMTFKINFDPSSSDEDRINFIFNNLHNNFGFNSKKEIGTSKKTSIATITLKAWELVTFKSNLRTPAEKTNEKTNGTGTPTRRRIQQ